ncbi:DUF927 domain-containing protein [Candidatus Kuenenia sp.]|uniref:DUF927 domain-containing protein n=1 Tax=Candidatus Kuenenia sp. TaxID=2499824 RepID=UPI00322077B7
MKETIDFRSFYTKHIPKFEANGKAEVSCLCPFHDDIHPSLSVNLEKGMFNCFACGKKGDAVIFLQLRYNLDKKGAMKMISEEAVSPPPTPASGGQIKPDAKSRGTAYLSLKQVKLIHTQLTKNETALQTFRSKYGLSLETIEKYFIGYQNDHYAIPMEAATDKWTIKEHKGTQTKGAKAMLYPNIAPEGLPYIIITEGEFKALLLNQNGFPATSGTAGAGTWKREWNAFFCGLNVILAYDNDEAGKEGSQKVIYHLQGTAGSIKTIVWPSGMDSKDRKDVTDYFVTMGKTKEDFQRLVDNAKEVLCEIKEIAGIKFIEPEGFEVEEGRVVQTTYYGNTSVKKPAFYAPVFIVGRAIDVELGLEDVRIAFKRDGKLKYTWVSKRVISDSKKILEISDQGLPVNSRNAGKMVEYLATFEACNMNIIPRTYISKGVGRKTIEGKQVFILNKMVQGNKTFQDGEDISVEFFPEPGFERFVKALEPSGAYEKWRMGIEPAIKHPYAAFALYASFAAPLLRMLKAPNFIIDFWGQTSLGKTTVLELAASVWGNPHKEAGGLVFGWDATRVFLERIANFFCDIPIFPDDSQTVDDRTMTSMLYQVANGVGRGRGSTAGIRHTPTWHTICFSTGERPLCECTNFSGARARTIELYGSPFPNAGAEFINDLKQCIRENYGHAGIKFIQGLLSLWNSQVEVARLKSDYKMYQRALSAEASSEVGDRYSQYFAVVKLAADLVNNILGIDDAVTAKENIDKVFDRVIDESLEDVDIGTRAMQFLMSWASGNEKYFKKTDGESYGQWKDGEYIGVYPHKLAEVLRQEKYSVRGVLKAWAEKKWIKVEGGKFTCSRTVRIEEGTTKNRRLTIIPWHVVKSFNDI